MPKRRAFRYSTLLRVRRLQEEEEAQRLAAIRRELRAALHEREFLAQEQVRMFREAASATKRLFAAANVHLFYIYERHLARRAVETDARIAALRTRESDRRRDLEEATRRKRMIERLEDHHVTALRAEINREDQGISDETAVSRAAHRRTERQVG